MIVGFNEAHFLQQCLDSISFCDEIVYTDLGSADDSVKIAEEAGATIHYHDKVPSCEMIQAKMVHQLKNNWVIFIDPDERVDPILAVEIHALFNELKNAPNTGAVLVPWIFYFKKRKLRGTVWGGLNHKYFLVNRNRFEFAPVVHYGRKILPGYQIKELAFTGSNILHHYWMNDYNVFFKKHKRYLKNEGIDRYQMGIRQSKKSIIIKPFKEFYKSFITKRGYKDGIRGYFLSVFWAYYETYIGIDLLRIQRKMRLNK